MKRAGTLSQANRLLALAITVATLVIAPAMAQAATADPPTVPGLALSQGELLRDYLEGKASIDQLNRSGLDEQQILAALQATLEDKKSIFQNALVKNLAQGATPEEAMAQAQLVTAASVDAVVQLAVLLLPTSAGRIVETSVASFPTQATSIVTAAITVAPTQLGTPPVSGSSIGSSPGPTATRGSRATGTDTTETFYCSKHLYDEGVCTDLNTVSVQGKDTDVTPLFKNYVLGLATPGKSNDSIVVQGSVVLDIAPATPRRFEIDPAAEVTRDIREAIVTGKPLWVEVFQRLSVVQSDLYSVALQGGGVQFDFQPEVVLSVLDIAEDKL